MLTQIFDRNKTSLDAANVQYLADKVIAAAVGPNQAAAQRDVMDYENGFIPNDLQILQSANINTLPNVVPPQGGSPGYSKKEINVMHDIIYDEYDNGDDGVLRNLLTKLGLNPAGIKEPELGMKHFLYNNYWGPFYIRNSKKISSKFTINAINARCSVSLKIPKTSGSTGNYILDTIAHRFDYNTSLVMGPEVCFYAKELNAINNIINSNFEAEPDERGGAYKSSKYEDIGTRIKECELRVKRLSSTAVGNPNQYYTGWNEFTKNWSLLVRYTKYWNTLLGFYFEPKGDMNNDEVVHKFGGISRDGRGYPTNMIFSNMSTLVPKDTLVKVVPEDILRNIIGQRDWKIIMQNGIDGQPTTQNRKYQDPDYYNANVTIDPVLGNIGSSGDRDGNLFLGTSSTGTPSARNPIVQKLPYGKHNPVTLVTVTPNAPIPAAATQQERFNSSPGKMGGTKNTLPPGPEYSTHEYVNVQTDGEKNNPMSLANRSMVSRETLVSVGITSNFGLGPHRGGSVEYGGEGPSTGPPPISGYFSNIQGFQIALIRLTLYRAIVEYTVDKCDSYLKEIYIETNLTLTQPYKTKRSSASAKDQASARADEAKMRTGYKFSTYKFLND